ncbi:hypothetical protein ACP26F_09865 [Franconibacter pulveris 1160]|uniref:hypothetical protein n=1 Tax=Franconibacter pulveris TaxID=435910 RepID=UPI0004649C55|nr:hypothetical protein [Franconibacter pulveris]
MVEEQFIFSETMRLVAAEIGDRGFDTQKVEELFNKYYPTVKSLYQQHKRQPALSIANIKRKP